MYLTHYLIYLNPSYSNFQHYCSSKNSGISLSIKYEMTSQPTEWKIIIQTKTLNRNKKKKKTVIFPYGLPAVCVFIYHTHDFY